MGNGKTAGGYAEQKKSGFGGGLKALKKPMAPSNQSGNANPMGFGMAGNAPSQPPKQEEY